MVNEKKKKTQNQIASMALKRKSEKKKIVFFMHLIERHIIYDY